MTPKDINKVSEELEEAIGGKKVSKKVKDNLEKSDYLKYL